MRRDNRQWKQHVITTHTSSTGTLRVIQIILSIYAHDMLAVLINQKQIEVCLPGKPNKHFARTNPLVLLSDDDLDTTIWKTCRCPHLAVASQNSGSGFSRICVKNGPSFSSCYLSPDRSCEEFSQFIADLDDAIDKDCHKEQLIVGYFNAWVCSGKAHLPRERLFYVWLDCAKRLYDPERLHFVYVSQKRSGVLYWSYYNFCMLEIARKKLEGSQGQRESYIPQVYRFRYISV